MKIAVQKKIVVSISLLCVLFVVFSLFRVFSGEWMLPQMFTVGPLNIRYYGVTMALAVGAGWWLALRRAPHYGFTGSQADILFQWLVVAGFVGARLYHVASSWQYYWQYPLESVKIWHGGLSIFGALLGGFVVLLIFGFKRNLKTTHNLQPTTYNLLDWLAPSVLLGQIIGRFGNFFNYEAFGYPTSLPWKMFVPEYFRPSTFLSASYFHPLFLYEALGNAVILLVLMYFFRPGRRQKFDSRMTAGALFFSYLLLYNVLRFAIEHLRIDSTFLFHNIRLNALVSGVLVIIAAAGLYGIRRYAKTVAVAGATH